MLLEMCFCSNLFVSLIFNISTVIYMNPTFTQREPYSPSSPSPSSAPPSPPSA